MGVYFERDEEGDIIDVYYMSDHKYPIEVIEDVTFDRKCFVHLGYDVRYNPNFFDKQKLVYLKNGGSNVTSFIMPSDYIHNGKRFVIRRIGSRCFAFYQLLRDISLCDIKYIDDKAFTYCKSLMAVNNIPLSLISIGDSAFSGCECLETFIIPHGVDYYHPGNLKSIGKNAFSGCTSLDIVIPRYVEKIGENAFKDVPHITYYGNAKGAPWGAKSMN